jgi:hypothetical protein
MWFYSFISLEVYISSIELLQPYSFIVGWGVELNEHATVKLRYESLSMRMLFRRHVVEISSPLSFLCT